MHRLLPILLLLATSADRSPQNWPAFRGAEARGTVAGATPPSTWDLNTSINVAWKTTTPGLGHSSPIVWGNRVYVTTAVAASGAAAGRIYLSSQEGDIFVVRAGRTFEVLSTNPMGEIVMATLALTGDMLIVRTLTQLVGIKS